MNYQDHYYSLVRRAQVRQHPDGYTEKHHIIPRSLGGVNDQSNLVILTAREHFVAHLLLAKIHGGGMWHAAFMMSNMGRYSNRQYEVLRKEHATLVGNFMRGRKKPEGFGQRVAEDKERAIKIGDSLIGKPKTEAHKQAWKESRKNGAGWVVSDQRKTELSVQMTGSRNHMWGETHSLKSRQVISAANKQQITCPHCNKEGGIAIMKRWHFENCKSAPQPKERKRYPILVCPHCGKNGGGAQMVANHFDSCKKRLT